MEGDPPDFSEALDAVVEQPSWPTMEQRMAIHQQLMMTLYNLALQGYVDPVRLRNRDMSPGVIASKLTDEIERVLK